MRFMEKMEKKFSRYAIRNLMLYLIILYAAGYIILNVTGGTGFYVQYLSLNIERILHGEIWRLITFLMLPPSSGLLYFALMMYIYFSLGRSLENLWGSFYFNLYILTGIAAEVIAALILYLVTHKAYLLTADSLYMTLLLAFALTIPDAQFLFFFVIPIRAKYLAVFYGILELSYFFQSDWIGRVEMIASFANFLIFFLFIKRPVQRVKQVRRRIEFERKVNAAQQAAASKPRHCCAVCGRTNESNPELEFRYCSKCSGGKEYCMDHLYTHIHVTEEDVNA